MNGLPNRRWDRDEFSAGSIGRTVLIHHFLRLETDAVEVAFEKEDEVDQFVAVRDGGSAGARFLGEVKDGGGDQDSFGVVFVVDMAGRYFEFGALHFEKAVGLKELLLLAEEGRHVRRLHDNLIFRLRSVGVFFNINIFFGAVQDGSASRSSAHDARRGPKDKEVQFTAGAFRRVGGQAAIAAADQIGKLVTGKRRPIADDGSDTHPGRIREYALDVLVVPLLIGFAKPGRVAGPSEGRKEQDTQ